MLIAAYSGRRCVMNTVGGVVLVARGLSGDCPVNSMIGRGRPRDERFLLGLENQAELHQRLRRGFFSTSRRSSAIGCS